MDEQESSASERELLVEAELSDDPCEPSPDSTEDVEGEKFYCGFCGYAPKWMQVHVLLAANSIRVQQSQQLHCIYRRQLTALYYEPICVGLKLYHSYLLHYLYTI